jgi:hypothetical protein
VLSGRHGGVGADERRDSLGIRPGHVLAVMAVVTALVGAAPAASAQLPFPWRQVEGGSFGDPGNRGVVELHAFGERLFAGTARRAGTGPAQLWSSATGEPGSWTRVTDIRPALPSSTSAVGPMTSAPGGPAFVGTRDAATPGIYRSADGLTWELVSGPGSGWTAGTATGVAALEVFDGALYVGTRDRRGAELWRLRVSGGRFERVLNLQTVDRATDAITALRAFGGSLYAGTHRRRGQGRLWRSASGDSGSWRRVRVRSRRPLSAGNSTMGAALFEYRGQLIATTRNDKFGAEAYSTRNGRRWRVEIVAGIDQPRNKEVHDLAEAFGELWLTTLPGPAQVWRVHRDSAPLSEGLAFGQANEDGFGRPRTIRGGAPVVAGFRDAVFWGGEHRRRGAQLWRLDRGTLQRLEATGPGIEFAPGPLRLSARGVVELTIRCPQSDPLGCHGDVSVKSVPSVKVRGRRMRLLIGEKIFEIDSGESLKLRFRVPRDVQRILRRLGRVLVRARNVALDNAKNTSAETTLEASRQ